MANRSYVYPAKTLNQHRNKFKMPHTVKTTFLHGRCVPFDVIEVLPGDTFKMDVASLIRMSTPIAPIMDNITMHLAAYFVPNRVSYENWEQLMGANKTGAWTADTASYIVPKIAIPSIGIGTIGDYMGLSASAHDAADIASALPGRDYYLIWNEFYRNQNVTAPVPVDRSSNDHVIVPGGGISDSGYNGTPMLLGKYSDYFTKCLPEPQKGPSVPFVADNLPVGIMPLSTANSVTASLGYIPAAGNGDLVLGTFEQAAVQSGSQTGAGVIAKAVDEAWNNINALRFAFQLQKFYEADARYGSRYFEILNGHFGVTNPDLVLSRPEFLGELNWRINIDQVLSTAGYAASSSTTVGAPGANSVTAQKGALFTKSFTEHGYVIIVGGCRHEHTYSQGWNKIFQRRDRLDFYDPIFANIGEQPVYNGELFAAGGPGINPNGVFGYQEAWAEYRFIPDRCTGLMNPAVSGALDFWSLADNFAAAPLLNDTFIYENRNAISRCLVTGAAGPDYIADFYFDLTAVREMPLFSIPGLADHH